jgi:mannose-6-phosphate isomerase-like protein (cupin superfamily)
VEHVGGDVAGGELGVVDDDLGEGPAVVDAVLGADLVEHRVVGAEVAVAVPLERARGDGNVGYGLTISPTHPRRNFLWFMDDEAFEETDRPGFRRRILTGDTVQLCFWRIKGGSEGSVLHHHPDHEQVGIVVRGQLQLRIGDLESAETTGRATLGPGELYLAPRGVWHGDSRFIGDPEHDECWIMDVFVPPRDDWGAPDEQGKLGYRPEAEG